MPQEAGTLPPPPPASAPSKNFVTIVIGLSLVAIGAILINHGMNAVQTEIALIVGVGLIAAGGLLVFAGASRVCQRAWVNLGMLIVGICLLVASGTQLSSNWSKAVYGIVLTVVGIAMIVAGVEIAKNGWEKYAKK
ncbi:MAG: hypothetical protein ACP5PX_00800 [Candidatus Hadarchaeum sp.]|uniref:hypothetical protein n=1 Tax=Candidatus Hadarchaeum sp. TaxID=2883567 RepID=UPI003D0DC210